MNKSEIHFNHLFVFPDKKFEYETSLNYNIFSLNAKKFRMF